MHTLVLWHTVSTFDDGVWGFCLLFTGRELIVHRIPVPLHRTEPIRKRRRTMTRKRDFIAGMHGMVSLSRRYKVLIQIAADIVCFMLGYMIAFIIIPASAMDVLSAVITGVLTLVLLYLFHYYNVRVKTSSFTIVVRGLEATIVSFAVAALVLILTGRTHSVTFAFVLYSYFLLFSFGARFSFRFLMQASNRKKARSDYPTTIVYGAGEIGTTLARQYFEGKLDYDIIGFVDDDPSLQKTEVLGLPVLGTVDSLSDQIRKHEVKTVIIGITDLPQDNLYKAVDAAKDNGADIKIIPTLYEMQQGAREIDLRNLDYPDLLGRPLIKIDKAPIEAMVRDKVVLVTGACGSIGSEICRQLVGFGVRRLVMIDIDESGLHDAGLRLTGFKEEINDSIIPILCDIRNAAKIERIFRQFRPDIVYHAAAYKHVPMGEREPDEIIRTNVAGSYNVLSSAKNSGVGKVVVISTDKAVNPTNVMGASKRMVELVASMLTSSSTEIVAVRFGNVLGSRGSMLPLFIDQIHAGVPITVTHKDIIRYFMAIPEAVSLVLKAGAMAKGGEVMVLDMGQPVKIYDFAQRLIKYYGDGRSSIVVTGLRPGEKLYEELLAKEDTTIPTDDKLVFKAKLNDQKLDADEFMAFYHDMDSMGDDELEARLRGFVPEFTDQHSHHVLKEE